MQLAACFPFFSTLTSVPDTLRAEDWGRHVWGPFQMCEHSCSSTGWMPDRTPILSLRDIRQPRNPLKQAVQLAT